MKVPAPIIWFMSALLLVVVADFAPRFAVILSLLLVAGVASIHGDELAAYMSSATKTIQGKK